ncbi:unnamed protein product, partial [Iphiclides podalirius]
MTHVRVNEGVLEGELVNNEIGGQFYSFKGIPYAEAPVGDLRFKAPRPPKPWKGVRSAKEFGPICLQYDMFVNKICDGSEDCLYLNIYSPNIKPKNPLAVMVWIHGGGYISGSGNDDFYGPEFLVRHGVILVTLNYRLEVLGFLCLDSEDVPDINSKAYNMINIVTKMWTDFAKSGNPTPDFNSDEKWIAYTTENKAFLEIGERLVAQSAPEKEDMLFWETLLKEYEQYLC